MNAIVDRRIMMQIGKEDMPKKLLLLARRFPFNHGEVAAEAYLETEINLLAPYFDEILAVGTEASPADMPTCSLSSNVVPLALGCGDSCLDKSKYLVRGLTFAFSTPGLIKSAVRSDPVHNMVRYVFRQYFAARALTKYQNLIRRLCELDYVPTEVYSFWFYDTALVALWIKNNFHCDMAVSRAHRYDLYANRHSFNYIPFRRLLFSGLDAIFPCSLQGKKYIESTWPNYSQKLVPLYLGTRDLPDESNEAGTDIFTIVSCSRLVNVKRVSLIADALTLLDRDGIHLQWIHYGNGPLLPEIRRICSKFTTVKTSFPGNVPNSKLLQIYSQHHFDLFINVSSSEGLPISIMEACGIGLPVLATDVGGTSEIVHDGINGRLLPPDCSPQDLADNIQYFMSLDKESLAHMRGASRRIWKNSFRARVNVQQFAHILMEGE